MSVGHMFVDRNVCCQMFVWKMSLAKCLLAIYELAKCLLAIYELAKCLLAIYQLVKCWLTELIL
jgi:hypothetical protein